MTETHATQAAGSAEPDCSQSDYRWLLRRIEEDKWPLLYAGSYWSREQVLDLVAEVEHGLSANVTPDRTATR